MKLIRWIVVGGVVIMMLPSDEEGQAQLAKKAVSTAHYASTTCERHPDGCKKAGEIWTSVKKKAEFAGRTVWDMAFNRPAGETPPQKEPQRVAAPQPKAPMAPAKEQPAPKRETRLLDGTPKRETGSLRPADRAVPWQGNDRAR